MSFDRGRHRWVTERSRRVSWVQAQARAKGIPTRCRSARTRGQPGWRRPCSYRSSGSRRPGGWHRDQGPTARRAGLNQPRSWRQPAGSDAVVKLAANAISRRHRGDGETVDDEGDCQDRAILDREAHRACRDGPDQVRCRRALGCRGRSSADPPWVIARAVAAEVDAVIGAYRRGAPIPPAPETIAAVLAVGEWWAEITRIEARASRTRAAGEGEGGPAVTGLAVARSDSPRLDRQARSNRPDQSARDRSA
jgi:hypothetical protein